MEPRRIPVAVPLLRRRRRARARRGPGASSCSRGARVRDVPLPRALLRLHHRRPNFFSAISADELVSSHLPLERLQGWVFLELLSLTRLPVAAPVSPA